MKSDALASALGGLVIWGGILFVIFLTVRVFWLWYFKLDRIVDLLERIEDKLAYFKKTHEQAQKAPPPPPVP